jgi:hypothetical protein
MSSTNANSSRDSNKNFDDKVKYKVKRGEKVNSDYVNVDFIAWIFYTRLPNPMLERVKYFDCLKIQFQFAAGKENSINVKWDWQQTTL